MMRPGITPSGVVFHAAIAMMASCCWRGQNMLLVGGRIQVGNSYRSFSIFRTVP